MSHRPIFIIGTERSGSNLLRLVLNAHPRIVIPHPPHIMRYFSALESSYGDLDDDRNMRRLVDDVLLLIRVHIYPWEFRPTPQAIMRHAQRSLFGIFANIYEQFMTASGKARWGCKSTFMIHHVDTIFQHYPQAKLPWGVRDPRDVATSSRKSVFSPFHPYLTAELWRDQQAEGLALQERLPTTALLQMHYEALLADPEGQVRRICAFLEEDFQPEMLRFHETEAAQKSMRLSQSWKNAGKPVLRDNTRKYRKELSPLEIQQVESACREPMLRLGYSMDFPAIRLPRPDTLEKLELHAQDLRSRVKVELQSMRGDANHWRRWARAGLMATLEARARSRSRSG